MVIAAVVVSNGGDGGRRGMRLTALNRQLQEALIRLRGKRGGDANEAQFSAAPSQPYSSRPPHVLVSGALTFLLSLAD